MHRQWLRGGRGGVRCDAGRISPLLALDAEEVAAKFTCATKITKATYLACPSLVM